MVIEIIDGILLNKLIGYVGSQLPLKLNVLLEGVNGVHLKSVISKILAKKSVISKIYGQKSVISKILPF